MKKVNDLLNYNGLKIVQNTEWFNFSLDSVLLAYFAQLKDNMKIIDLCTGNAPIPLFLSTKTNSKIIGVELQKEVYELAKKSVAINNLCSQINIINEDVNNIVNLFDSDTFDLITCNPPYFKNYKDSIINENYIKAIARHEIKLKLDDIFLCARKILKNKGKIVLVHRTERLIDIITIMRKLNIEPKRIRFVYPFSDSLSNLVLIEGVKNGKTGLKIEKNLVIHNNDGTYTNEVKDIFKGGKNED